MSDQRDRWGEDRGASLVRPPKRRWPGALLITAMLLLSAVTILTVAHPLYLYLVFNKGSRYAKVVGTVTYKDTPLPSGTITFVAEGLDPGTGEISDDGSYTVLAAPTGDVCVCVTSDPPKKGKDKGSSGAPGRAIPRKYASPSSSPLRFTIKKGTNQIDIYLID